MARRKRRKDGHDIPHLDEKWLVSYSDLMTLLFGLFVMLYSFALKHKGAAEAVERELKKISEKGFQTEQTAQSGSPKDPTLDNMDDNELKKIIQQMRKEIMSLQDQLAKAQSELSIQDLAKAQISKEMLDAKEKNLQELKKALEKMQSRSIASAQEQRRVEQIKPAGAQSSVLVYVRWQNRNHDIDLSVLTPDKKEINFKNKKISADDPDEFISDATSGPGIELFKSAVPKDGEYEFSVSLYNSRGDESSSEVQLFVMVNGQEQLVEKFVLKDEDEKRAQVKKLNLKSFGL